MPTACIQQPGAKLVLESARLVASWVDEAGESHKRDIPLHDLERLILSEAVSITSPALAETLRRAIPVSLLDFHGRFLGSFQPAASDHGAARLRHYQRSLDPEFALVIARKIIVAKIYNQRRLVQRVAANRKAEDLAVPEIVPAALDALDRAMSAAGMADSLDSLRGHEGLAAARYFAAWAALFPPEFAFERRSTRPPLNPVNAVLSFASTLVYNETHAFIHAHGLDPALGILHTTENGRWSLALDLMEPFRPALVEPLTLRMFSLGILTRQHFQPHGRGVYLNPAGRNLLFGQYEDRLAKPFMDVRTGTRTTFRSLLAQAPLDFKMALADPSRLTPFLLQ